MKNEQLKEEQEAKKREVEKKKKEMEEQRQAELKRKLDAELAAKKASGNDEVSISLQSELESSYEVNENTFLLIMSRGYGVEIVAVGFQSKKRQFSLFWPRGKWGLFPNPDACPHFALAPFFAWPENRTGGTSLKSPRNAFITD